MGSKHTSADLFSTASLTMRVSARRGTQPNSSALGARGLEEVRGLLPSRIEGGDPGS